MAIASAMGLSIPVAPLGNVENVFLSNAGEPTIELVNKKIVSNKPDFMNPSDGPIPMTSDSNLHALVVDHVRKNLARSVEIIDLGAGQGALSYRLSQAGYKNVVSVDQTREYWRLPEGNLQLLDLNTSFHQYFNKQFDLVCAIEIIEHVENPYQFLRSCHQLLKPNGMLILSTPNVESFSSRMIFLWNGRLRFFSEEETFNHHVTPIFGWYLFHCFRKIGYKDEVILFTHDRTEISNSFKARVAEKTLRLFRFLMKGSKIGENRIHIVRKDTYIEPTSK
jgi:2-polyprenyl-3-methyl-5-hydroxy-6-metoxy-1,4-benzoquinol methylase